VTPSPQWRSQGSKVGSTVGHASSDVSPPRPFLPQLPSLISTFPRTSAIDFLEGSFRNDLLRVKWDVKRYLTLTVPSHLPS